jgi:hypothetical protein
VFFPYYCFILLKVLLDVGEKLLEVLLVIQNQLVDDGLVKLVAWKFIRIAFNNH